MLVVNGNDWSEQGFGDEFKASVEIDEFNGRSVILTLTRDDERFMYLRLSKTDIDYLVIALHEMQKRLASPPWPGPPTNPLDFNASSRKENQ